MVMDVTKVAGAEMAKVGFEPQTSRTISTRLNHSTNSTNRGIPAGKKISPSRVYIVSLRYMIYFALLLPPCGILSVVLRELVVYLISVLATIDAPQGAAPPPIVPEVIEVILVHAPRHMGEEARRSNQLTKPGP